MAVRAVRDAPYRGAIGLLNWLREPGRWHELDGRCAAAGVDPDRLPFARFLNLVYATMVDQAERRELLTALRVERDPRDALDEPLAVKSWPLPGATPRPVRAREPGVPDWWVDDADASDTFLAAMGVRL